MTLSLNDFGTGRESAAALALLTAQPVPAARLLSLLNDPDSVRRMVHAEETDRAPLGGVVHLIEGDSVIVGALASRTSGKDFRLAVGVAVKLKMLDLGWSTNGRQGPVTNSRYFERGERFKPPS